MAADVEVRRSRRRRRTVSAYREGGRTIVLIPERFTRADTSRVRATGAPRGASTGLGLAIVSAVVEAHHGTVTVQSRPGATSFVVSLPLDQVTAPIPD